MFPKYTVCQLGFDLPSRNLPDLTAGKYDDKLSEVFQALKKLDVPIYIRFGYECNGKWNHFEPEAYKAAFQHVTKLLRESQANAATVWCVVVGVHTLEKIMKFYPGDEWVDWWAVDLFRLPELTKCKPLMEEAHKHGKPMMIGESTPLGVGVLNGQASWNTWFAPYFDLIRTTPGIKAFCYINWDWSEHPRWKNWGDARVQQNPVVLDLYRKEMSLPLYLHASTKEAFQQAITAPKTR